MMSLVRILTMLLDGLEYMEYELEHHNYNEIGNMTFKKGYLGSGTVFINPAILSVGPQI